MGAREVTKLFTGGVLIGTGIKLVKIALGALL